LKTRVKLNCEDEITKLRRKIYGKMLEVYCKTKFEK
jgi:hypothetical protein